MRIDCSVTQNFMKEFSRMCKYLPNCKKCDMNLAGEFGTTCYEDCMSTLQCDGHMSDIQEIVQNWSDNHPQKTYLEDFKEKYPNAPLAEDGTPTTCPKKIGFKNIPNCNELIRCVECWNQLMQ